MTDQARIDTLIDEVTPDFIALRRALHEIPEASHEEHRTTALIVDALTARGVPHRARLPETGLWVDTGPQPAVAFRADLDALPIQEPEDRVPRSKNQGWMHACGHDAHAAIAFGVAVVLHGLELPAGARVIFQPAEESFPGGASDLVAEGLADGLKGILAFHVDPSLATGKVGSRVGPITASADRVSITLEGPGGHTARPHLTVDLVADAARLVHELPGALRKGVDARSPLTVAFGSIHGGRSGNVIPTRVEINGTARTLDRDLWEALPGRVEETVAGLMANSDAAWTVEYEQVIPPVINDEAVVGAATGAISSRIGSDVVVPTAPSMGGEDFANYLAVTPGALLRLGCSVPGATDLHSPGFVLDEAAVGFGVRAGVTAMLGLLEGL